MNKNRISLNQRLNNAISSGGGGRAYYFPVQLNDVINCEELRAYNADGRIRFYQSNGVQGGYANGGVVNIQVAIEGYINARLMMLNSRASIPSQLTVTHADGTIDTYKIIDRR